MRKASYFCGVLVLVLSVAGCNLIAGLAAPKTTTVRLINNGRFPVDVTLYYSDNQDVPRDVLTSLGTRLDLTIAAGDATSFSRDCDGLQAIVIDKADLRVIGGAGPSADTSVLRDGTDFGCGDTITFSFDHSDLIVDFKITTSVQ